MSSAEQSRGTKASTKALFVAGLAKAASSSSFCCSAAFVVRTGINVPTLLSTAARCSSEPLQPALRRLVYWLKLAGANRVAAISRLPSVLLSFYASTVYASECPEATPATRLRVRAASRVAFL